ncbi:MAG TPA: glycosyltransferase family 9 protein [Ktedonobacterales bacterium]|nr:glycosyltransferase family 9 protein [Ktedonobacterales bacterium]
MNTSPSVVGKYVVIRPGALGDALIAFPALALVRCELPEAHVTLVARRDVLAVTRSSGLADGTCDYDDPAWSALFAAKPHPVGHAYETVAGSRVVAWLADPDRLVANNLDAFGARQAIVAVARPAPDSGAHAALLLARSLAPLGITPPASLQDLPPPPLLPRADDVVCADAVWRALGLPDDSPVVALHSGSGGAAKRWPPERFAQLARMVAEAGVRPLLIEGPQDAAVTARVVAACSPMAPPVARDLGVGALAALLRRCAAYVGNDSGVSHLAGLAGVATLALFGPTDPALWAPLGPRVRVLRSPAKQVDDLQAGDVAKLALALVQSLGH